MVGYWSLFVQLQIANDHSVIQLSLVHVHNKAGDYRHSWIELGK